MRKADRSESERGDALMALHEIERPNRTLLSALERAMSREPDSTSGRMALLATSSLARRGGAAAELAKQEIERSFRRGEPATALRAIGNWGLRDDLERVKEWVDDRSAAVRAASFDALRKYPAADAVPILTIAVGSEQDPSALATALERATQFFPLPPSLQDELVDAAAARLQANPSRNLREALIRLLGAAAGTSDDARRALQAHYFVETELDLRRAIGRFLPASALASRPG